MPPGKTPIDDRVFNIVSVRTSSEAPSTHRQCLLRYRWEKLCGREEAIFQTQWL